MTKYLLLILAWWGMSIVKFLFTPSLMMASTAADKDSWLGHDWSFLEIVGITTTGAALGVFLFYSFGERLFAYLDSNRTKPRKRFSRGSRFIARIRGRYGLTGLLLICGLISVPISSLLAARYYRSNTTMAFLVMAFAAWAVVLTGLSFLVKLLF